MIEWLHDITHNEWFVLVDLVFHMFILGHVIAHICRAGKRLHRWVHEPLRRWWRSLFVQSQTEDNNMMEDAA